MNDPRTTKKVMCPTVPPRPSVPSAGPTLRGATVYVHPTAICESSSVGDGTKVWAFAHVMDGAVVGQSCNLADRVFVESGVRIGDRVTVKNHAMIFRGVTIEDDVFVGPGVVFTNDRYPRSPRMAEVSARYRREASWLVPTHIRRGATLGAGAVILPGVDVGAYATVGAGSVVTQSVAAHRLVMGNPARPVGWVCLCGGRLGEALDCDVCDRRYRPNGDALQPAE